MYSKVMFIPISTVRFEPSLWYGSYEATSGCEVEMVRSGMLLGGGCQRLTSLTSENASYQTIGCVRIRAERIKDVLICWSKLGIGHGVTPY